jgi:Zn-finger nucleic acid-binding protein
MDCPRCEAEMVLLEGKDGSMSRCPECGGLWLDLAELNRILLRHNLPGLESLGGRVNAEETTGVCPEDQVDLVAVEGGERHALQYETCEVCGGIFLQPDTESEDLQGNVDSLVDFYRRFGNAKGAVKSTAKRA